MRYLGALRGAGTIVIEAGSLGRADYELDAYLVKPGQVVASGELRMQAKELDGAFGRNDLSLQTDDGKTLEVRFSGKRLGIDVAHVDVRSGLPDEKNWRR